MFINSSCMPLKARRHLRLFGLLLFAAAATSALYAADASRKIIDGESAISRARKGYEERRGIFPDDYRINMRGSAPAGALLVKRLDEIQSSYYIVPFYKQGRAVILIIIDAYTGNFKQISSLKKPIYYPKTDGNKARLLLAEHLAARKKYKSKNIGDPYLVWKPSKQSQSMYYPFWEFAVDSMTWHVDLNGAVFEKIENDEMKGGAGPFGKE